MREPPINLSDDTLRAGLRDHYGLMIADLAFLPIGHDASAWVYRARTSDGAAYFLKARLRVANLPSLLVPRHLHDHSVARVVAPIPTLAGQLWASAGGYALILYPFIAGVTGMDAGLSDQQWIDYGATLRQIHDTPLSAELAADMRRESFVPAGVEMIARLDQHIGDRSFDEPSEQELARHWRARRDEIRTILARALELAQRLARTTPPLVLCHADIHTGNVLVDTEGQVWIVDWDETMLAPRERDLMFAVGGISAKLVSPHQEALFLQGYGPLAIDRAALACYRYAWAVSDISSWAEQVYFRPDLGALTKREGVRFFKSLFEPGEIVSLAFASDLGDRAL